MKKQYIMKMVLLMIIFFGMSSATFSKPVPVLESWINFCYDTGGKNPQQQAAETCPSKCEANGLIYKGKFFCKESFQHRKNIQQHCECEKPFGNAAVNKDPSEISFCFNRQGKTPQQQAAEICPNICKSVRSQYKGGFSCKGKKSFCSCE